MFPINFEQSSTWKVYICTIIAFYLFLISFTLPEPYYFCSRVKEWEYENNNISNSYLDSLLQFAYHCRRFYYTLI